MFSNLAKRAGQTRVGSLFSNQSKRYFSNGGNGGRNPFDRVLEAIIRRIPGGNVGALMVALNSICYFLYLIWPRYQMYSYLNNFTFSKFNLSHGRLHTFLTCHFTHMSMFTFLLDSVIMYLFCQNVSMMYGSLFVMRTIGLAMLLSSFLLFMQQTSTSGIAKPFYGNDAIMRGLIFTIIFSNPTASFYLLPLPIQIPAWAIAAVILGLDFLSFNTAAFGGVTAAYLMVNYL